MPLARRLLAVAVLLTAACHPSFVLKNYTTNADLYRASLREFQRHHWDNAVTGFEKLTTDLPPRDTLLSRSYWYLATAHQHKDEWLLAAQSFQRLVENFPDDSLADDAALEAARSYRKLWRKPSLDDQYGQTALASYQQFLGLFPNSPLVPQAQKEIAQLNEWFARKDYEAGMTYFRRKGYDSAIIYFTDVLKKYPETPTAKTAAIKLAEAYKAIRYKEDLADVCASLWRQYPTDSDVRDVCGTPPATPPVAPGATPGR